MGILLVLRRELVGMIEPIPVHMAKLLMMAMLKAKLIIYVTSRIGLAEIMIEMIGNKKYNNIRKYSIINLSTTTQTPIPQAPPETSKTKTTLIIIDRHINADKHNIEQTYTDKQPIPTHPRNSTVTTTSAHTKNKTDSTLLHTSHTVSLTEMHKFVRKALGILSRIVALIGYPR
jgi:hypothetical protein